MDTELITEGTLSIEKGQAQTLVANQITQYLEQSHKELNQAVLDEMMAAFRKSVTKQLMSVRDTRKGYESCTVYSGACARKSRLQYDGVQGEPILARTSLKFLLGDLVELAVIGIAQLAGVAWTDNNRDLSITGHDGVKVNVHPDGLVSVPTRYSDDGLYATEWAYYNAEVKSCDSKTYDAWLANGGPDDRWGYKSQASVEVQAWKEAGYDVNATCFVAVSTGSRQGSVAEWVVPYDQSLVDGWHERRGLARSHDVPPIPFEAEQEMEYVAGKLIDASNVAHGEPKPRFNKSGKVYGWDVPTGRTILPLNCGYCQFKQTCWPNAQLDIVGTKPVWCVK